MAEREMVWRMGSGSVMWKCGRRGKEWVRAGGALRWGSTVELGIMVLGETRRPQPRLLRNAIPRCYRGRPLAGAGPAPWTSPTPTWRKSCRTRVHRATCPLEGQGLGTNGWNCMSTPIRP